MDMKLALWLLALTVGTQQMPTTTSTCHEVYVFGDSNSDTGGMVAVGIMMLNIPYGQTFPGHPDGRFSDGRLIIDFMTENLRLSYLSPYLESFGSNFANGANFPIAGSLAIPGKNASWGWKAPLDLQRQINQFAHYKSRHLVLQSQSADFLNALYVIDIGQNDLDLLMESPKEDVDQMFIPNIIGNNILSAEGAKYFWIHNTGPLGCLPYAVRLFERDPSARFDQYGCAISPNVMASEFNSKLKMLVSQLRTQLPQAYIFYVDVFSAKYFMIANAEKLGFLDPFTECYKCTSPERCEAGSVDPLKIGDSNKACKDPERHISWDGVHYTEAANRFVADWIVNGSLTDPPLPLVKACGNVYN